ncbi:MAG: hypothetical protein Q7S01_00055 [bacterium]|nr:hypothetical protein [bacterium]
MTEVNFGKIRDAAKEMINNTWGDSLSAKRETVFYILKGLRKNDPGYFLRKIEAESSRKRLRDNVGEERFRLFASVAAEKGKEYMREYDFPPETPEQGVPLSDYAVRETLRLVSEFLRLTEISIRKDYRIQEAFKGPKQLDELLQQRANVWNNFFQLGLLRISKSASPERH